MPQRTRSSAEILSDFAAPRPMKERLSRGLPNSQYLMGTFDAFLTHDWGTDEHNRDNHERVVRVSNALRALGLVVWLDETEMDGNVNQKMAEGVRESAFVVFFITKRYLLKASGLGPNGADDNWCAPRTTTRTRTRGAPDPRTCRAPPPRPSAKAPTSPHPRPRAQSPARPSHSPLSPTRVPP